MSLARRMLALILVWVAACGYDEDYTGMGQGALTPPEQPCDCRGGGEGEGEGEDLGTLDAPDLAGRLYRFTSLVLTAPITGALADPLNGYFEQEIDGDTLHVLMHVTGDDRASGDLTFDVGPGGGVAGTYALGDTPSELACGLEGATFATRQPARLDFPNELLDPPTLPIQELRLGGRFDAPGESIGDGSLEGALTRADAEAITLMGTGFAAFLEGLQLPPDLDLDGDGTLDAWRFEGTFDAAVVEAAR